MARPQALQLLKHGKALCGTVFRLFVETWNYIVQRADGIVGDRDVNADEGCIYIDNSTPERPVIRLDRSKLPKGGSGETVIINNPQYPSVFEIVEDSQTCGVSTYRFDNQFFEVSGVLYDLKSDYTFTLRSVADLYLAIVLSSVSDPQGYIEEYSTFEDMQADMADENKSVIPLYKFDSEGAVSCDLRHIPRADMWTIGGIELPSGGAAS